MRAVSVCSLVSVILMAIPAGASAQSQPSDPEADSPSGVVYELPVDRARKDAAPRRESSRRDGGDDAGSTGGGSSGDGPGGGGSSPVGGGSSGSTDVAGIDDTSIRSENNFGTSSRVPGADSSDTDGARRAERDGDGPGGTQDQPGEADAGGAIGDLGQLAPSSATNATDGPSDDVVLLLLAALVAVGGVIGTVAGRRAARDRRP